MAKQETAMEPTPKPRPTEQTTTIQEKGLGTDKPKK